MTNSEVSNAEATRKFKDNLNLDEIGITVTGIKKMKAEHLIMSVESGEDAIKTASAQRALDRLSHID